MITIDTSELYREFLNFTSDPEVKVISSIKYKNHYTLFKFNTEDEIAVKNELMKEHPENIYSNDLIFGKDKTKNVVNVTATDSSLHIFTETDGVVEEEIRPATYWMVSKTPLVGSKRLIGKNFYQHCKMYSDRSDFLKDRGQNRNRDVWSIYDEQEGNLVYQGITYFKGMKVSDVSVLSFDIESTGVKHNKYSKVVIISNTLRVGTEVIKKLFRYDEYESCAEMIKAWAEWVRDANPSIIVGHNIFGFDLPYLSYCYQKEFPDDDIQLGRDGSSIKYNNYTSEFRKDGSQSYEYRNIKIVGRDIVDTFFLSIKYDATERKYISYGLKSIIKQEGLEKTNRQHYDASLIGKNYKDKKEFAKIAQYGQDDSDDALKLFDMMIPAYFYYTQSIPKTLQQIINSATGSQINSFLIRGYISEGKSLPTASEVQYNEGAISMGIPGLYTNCLKLDVVSMYPSIILQYKVYDKNKDPDAKMLAMTEYFMKERLKNKELAKTTGEKHYKYLSDAQKIIVNSVFGMTGAPGINFNSPSNCGFIMSKGREILDKAIVYSTSKSAAYWKTLTANYEEENA